MNYLGVDPTSIILFYIKSYLSILRYYMKHMLKSGPILARSKALRKTAQGKRVFVFANGPSLSRLDPVKIASYQRSGYDVIAINSYINTDFARTVVPNYYVLSDPASFGIQYGSLTPEQLDHYLRDFSAVRSSGAKLFIPLQYYGSVRYEHTYAFCDAENFYSSNVSDILRPRGYLSQTAFKALSLAQYLGYETIYLCGLDNNYFMTIKVDENNNIHFVDRHFYAESEEVTSRSIQDLMGRKMSIGEVLYTFHFNFKHLERFSALPIINLDRDSLVDAFDKHHDLDVYIDDHRHPRKV